MAIVVQTYDEKLIIASRRTKLPSGNYFYARGHVTLGTDRTIITEHTCLNCNAIDPLTTYIVSQWKTEKHIACSLVGTNPKHLLSAISIDLPKDLSKKQIKQIQRFLDTYFNNK